MELVTLEFRLQNLGALGKEDLDIGVFFYPQNFAFLITWSGEALIIRTQLWWRNGSVRGFTNR